MPWLSIIAIEVYAAKPSVKEAVGLRAKNVQVKKEMSLLDLPELALECILEKLPPSGLCSMAGVCSSLRAKCVSDQLWERHMKQKWGRLIGNAAYREWQWHIVSGKRSTLSNGTHASSIWPFLCNRSKLETSNKVRCCLPVDSIMCWCLALETGKFRFPAQVYNRENGNVGFMLSCYDAELRYDSNTDTFIARYPPHRRRTIEENIGWDRVRPPVVDIPAYVLHASDCLDDLKPGDHIEIQWRRNREFPYGWWYGVVGHLEACDGSTTNCQCHSSDTVMLEFKQYIVGSQWRQTVINRKDHREVGNEQDGFYGGIRKLYHEEEISVWMHLWPTVVLE